MKLKVLKVSKKDQSAEYLPSSCKIRKRGLNRKFGSSSAKKTDLKSSTDEKTTTNEEISLEANSQEDQQIKTQVQAAHQNNFVTRDQTRPQPKLQQSSVTLPYFLSSNEELLKRLNRDLIQAQVQWKQKDLQNSNPQRLITQQYAEELIEKELQNDVKTLKDQIQSNYISDQSATEMLFQFVVKAKQKKK
ncbi:hypothetical protein OXYTRIMIC_741 [Oxytricha trifallax]|uniref:Uncharacterized protein n=1 Tax=Oxytricha trifallax TaxID=1172189 RepID=A0A073I0W8_9SPIT|nr:hypothetical protein OXYTRIMIC_741 [Oxytricha trifallax]